jgi:hypothetical protein
LYPGPNGLNALPQLVVFPQQDPLLLVVLLATDTPHCDEFGWSIPGANRRELSDHAQQLAFLASKNHPWVENELQFERFDGFYDAQVYQDGLTSKAKQISEFNIMIPALADWSITFHWLRFIFAFTARFGPQP